MFPIRTWVEFVIGVSALASEYVRTYQYALEDVLVLEYPNNRVRPKCYDNTKRNAL